MKIIFDARDSQLERVGVSVYCNNIIKILDKLILEDSEIEFITSSKLKQPDLINKVLPIGPSSDDSYLKKLKWYYSLPKLLRKLKADVYFGPLTTLPFQSKFSCKIVMVAHDAASISTSDLVGSYFSRIKNKYFTNGWVRKADHIICISEYCRNEFTEIYGAWFKNKSSVVHHGLPNEFGSNLKFDCANIELIKQKYSGGKDFLFSLGTIYPKKNYENLIEGFSKLKNSHINLVICGAFGFESERIMNAPKWHGVEGRVFFYNTLPTDVVIDLMSAAQAFVFPSLYEGFGIPLLEAFACNTPVVSSDATCLPEIAGDAAHYFDPTSIAQITEAISFVLSNDEYRKRLALQGKKRLKNFSWDKSAAEHLKIFKMVFDK